MTDAFATLNPDLLHLCLLHVQDGADAARAGRTCKHWRAVASTERLWRDICVKRWPSTAKLPGAPASHLEFYKQRRETEGTDWNPPSINLRRLTLLIDGHFGPGNFGRERFSEVLSFADATVCEFDLHFMEERCHGFEWPVQEMHDQVQDYDDVFLEVVVLRDDGKLAKVGHARAYDTGNMSWRIALDLEDRAEYVTLKREEWFHLHFVYAPDKLKICASHAQDLGDVEFSHIPEGLSEVLALLDWK